jgi:N-acetylglucosamine-6-phosphate deacetylase
VKWFIADGSVGFPHVRVGHCQASKLKNPVAFAAGFFFAIHLYNPIG